MIVIFAAGMSKWRRTSGTVHCATPPQPITRSLPPNFTLVFGMTALTFGYLNPLIFSYSLRHLS
jgi:hypothetical protein